MLNTSTEVQCMGKQKGRSTGNALERMKKLSSAWNESPLNRGGLQGGHRVTAPRADSTALTPSSPPLEKGGRSKTDDLPRDLRILSQLLSYGGDSLSQSIWVATLIAFCEAWAFCSTVKNHGSLRSPWLPKLPSETTHYTPRLKPLVF